MAQPKMYHEIADWWHLLSEPEHYAQEATFFRELMVEYGGEVRTVLELGCGGGNNALHLKKHFEITLVDLSPGMLEQSRKLNPECRHIEGDMRSLRLDQRFDAVFVHDAVVYMLTEDDLRAAMATAHAHLRGGGVALFVPDFTAESFHPDTKHGGYDGEDRGLRYLEWVRPIEPGATTYTMDFAYLLRHPSGEVEVMQDRHTCGLFPRATWIRMLEETGFRAAVRRDQWERELFVGVRKP